MQKIPHEGREGNSAPGGTIGEWGTIVVFGTEPWGTIGEWGTIAEWVTKREFTVFVNYFFRCDSVDPYQRRGSNDMSQEMVVLSCMIRVSFFVMCSQHILVKQEKTMFFKDSSLKKSRVTRKMFKLTQ